MFHEIQNHLGVLKLMSRKSIQYENIRSTLDIKYPWVSAWLKGLESAPVVRSYQIKFEKYLKLFQSSDKN
jgi:hypothetical protein